MLRSRKEKLYVICDIGSATVSAGLISCAPEGKPKIIFTTRVPISISRKSSSGNIEEDVMLSLLKSVLIKISDEGLAMAHSNGFKEIEISKVFLVFASPWFAYKALPITIQKREPFALDADFVEKTLKQEEFNFEKDALSGKYERVQNKDIRMVEREIIAVKLNGYETANPYNKEVTLAELSLYMSVLPESVVHKSTLLVRDTLHTEDIDFKTFPLVFYQSVQKLFPSERNFILVDAAGESTDVALVRSGVVEKIESSPIGKNTLLRSLMNKLSVSEDIALSHLKMLEEENLNEGGDIVEKGIVEEFKVLWQKSLSPFLEEVKHNGGAPGTIFLVSDSDIAPFFRNLCLKAGEPYGIVRVLSISSNETASLVESLKHTEPDKFIALEATVLNPQ